MRKVLILFLIMLLPSLAGAANIDLSSWYQEGPAGNGTWNVAADNESVLQTINGNPTVFLSNDSYINTSFEGAFKVQTASDDDYIGFVFGWQSPNDFYLFDWKQGDQSGSIKGYYLSHVTASGINDWYNVIPFSNHHIDNMDGYDVLATNLGTGWADNTLYDFKLDYTNSQIKIHIGTTEIFNLPGTYSGGNFGFYNYSQSQVYYEGFTEEVIPDPNNPIPEPATMLLFGLGSLGLAGLRRTKLVN